MIKINNLSFNYRSHKVLDKISLDLLPGHIYGLLGENGVGKTTLLNLLTGLIKPKEGTIEVDGLSPFDRKPSFLSNVIYVPESIIPENMTVNRYAISRGRFYENFDMNLFLKLLDILEVPFNKNMRKMSSGQIKKSYLSFALACKTKYLFLDEPTNALDIPSKSKFRSVLMKYTMPESTILISTHQARDLENIIDPIVILDRNQVLLNATIEKISEQFYFMYSTSVAGAHSDLNEPEILYEEDQPGGKLYVLKNKGYGESKVNVEALFNAIRNNKTML